MGSLDSQIQFPKHVFTFVLFLTIYMEILILQEITLVSQFVQMGN